MIRKNLTFQVIVFLFLAWITITLFEFISSFILGNGDIMSDGFFNTFKTISFLISCLSILFNHMYSNTYSFLVPRIELTAALVSIIFLVIVSVYMLLQALHLITDEEDREPPSGLLQWLYVTKVIVDLLALLGFSEYIIHPSIQVKLQLWKYIKMWKKLNDITFEELKKVTSIRKMWNNHFENMNALCASLISDLTTSLLFVIFFSGFDNKHYAKGYMVISLINFFFVLFLVDPLFHSVLKIFMQGKSELYESFYRKIIQELTYFEGSLGVKSLKFWMVSQNYIKGQIKIYSTKNIDRNKLTQSINKIVDDLELNADICIEFDE
jgi:Co/Zn/Cd efflux system component